MSDLESIFVKEFHQNVKVREYKDIFKVELPLSVQNWEVSGTELYAVKGIEDQYYSKLNKTIVKKLPHGMVAKRRVINKVTKSFKKNEDGSFVYEDYKVPSGCMVVISDVILRVPYKYKGEKGEDYIDFIETPKGVEYLYVLRKENLYKVHQTALALSVKNMKNYSGMGYTTWNSGVIYLHVIPYNPNSKYVGTKILKTGYSLNYNKEVSEILSYWQQKGVIPLIALCGLNDGTNLALKPTNVGYADYTPVDLLSLGDAEIYGNNGTEIDEEG